MKIQNHVRDESTGAGIASIAVTLQRKHGGAVIDTTTTDADGMFEFEDNGSPGDVEWTASNGSKTRVQSDHSIQAGSVYTGELEKIFALFSPGVCKNVDSEMAVTAPGGMNVRVSTGAALVKGIPHVQHSGENLSIGANGTANPRIDRVVVRVYRDGADIGKTELDVLAGTAAATPTAPNLTQTTSVWEESLAQIAVASGAGAIVTGNITDDRRYAAAYPDAGDITGDLAISGNLSVDGDTTLGDQDDNTTTIWGHIRSDHTTAPTIAVNTSVCGTGATATVDSGGDASFNVTITCGASGSFATGRMATVTFDEPYGSGNYAVALGIHSEKAAERHIFVTNRLSTGFQIHCATAPAASYDIKVSFTIVEHV